MKKVQAKTGALDFVLPELSTLEPETGGTTGQYECKKKDLRAGEGLLLFFRFLSLLFFVSFQGMRMLASLVVLYSLLGAGSSLTCVECDHLEQSLECDHFGYWGKQLQIHSCGKAAVARLSSSFEWNKRVLN